MAVADYSDILPDIQFSEECTNSCVEALIALMRVVFGPRSAAHRLWFCSSVSLKHLNPQFL